MKQIVKALIEHFDKSEFPGPSFIPTFKECIVNTYEEEPPQEREEELANYYVTFSRGEITHYEKVTQAEYDAINKAILMAEFAQKKRILDEIRRDIGL